MSSPEAVLVIAIRTWRLHLPRGARCRSLAARPPDEELVKRLVRQLGRTATPRAPSEAPVDVLDPSSREDEYGREPSALPGL